MNPQKLSDQEKEIAKKEIAKALKIDEEFNVNCDRAEGYFLIDNITHKRRGVIIHKGERLRIKEFDLLLLAKYPLMFFGCDFECKIQTVFFPPNPTELLYQSLRFLDCSFEEMVLLGAPSHRAIIYQIDKCTFKKSVNINGIFDRSVFFTNNIFESNVNFEKIIFKKQASFYGSTFKQCPNFAQSHFEEGINLVNTNLAFDFEDTENQINLASKNNDKNLVANDFRDSFRLFKNALSKEGNVLDASNYHKVELYCKEIELDSKPQKTWQDRIDSLQLWFYRLTSDHHTDLAKIFNNVMMLIALFGIFTFGITLCKEDYLHYEKQYFGRVMTSAIDLSIRKESHSLTKTTQCVKETQIPPKEALSILALCLSFVGIFIGFIALKDTKYKLISWCINISSYVIFLGILIYKPSLLLPFVGQLFDEGLKANFPAMQSLSVVYCILMFLMLFSLQKTARKNSIIPS